eukprot:s185_g17.t1
MRISGTPSDLVTQIREYYEDHDLPRHPKKSVEQAKAAEVQGAWLDGEAGTLSAKPAKIVKYIELTMEALQRGSASQRELQVIGGGLVYASMFRRPLLAGLNQIWRTIVEAGANNPFKRRWMSRTLMIELFRHIALLPLAFVNFRAPFDAEVTASDASTTGGGISVSRGLTPYGLAASLSQTRGDIPEEMDTMQVLSIGLFDGIAALRVALDILGAPVCGHISVEKQPEAQRVVESNFPDSEVVDDVEAIDEDMVRKWALVYGGASLVLIGSGPPCQGVSGLNFDRKGALKDHRSRLFFHVPRVVRLCRRFFPWAQVHSLTENVASMDADDCQVMNDEFELLPWFIDSHQMCLAHRPRLYWISWELTEQEGVEILLGSDGRLPIQGQVDLKAIFQATDFLEAGWTKVEGDKPFPTFTTSRPSATPMRRPAGIKDCDEEELTRWRQAQHKWHALMQHRETGPLEFWLGEFESACSTLQAALGPTFEAAWHSQKLAAPKENRWILLESPSGDLHEVLWRLEALNLSLDDLIRLNDSVRSLEARLLSGARSGRFYGEAPGVLGRLGQKFLSWFCDLDSTHLYPSCWDGELQPWITNCRFIHPQLAQLAPMQISE